MKISIAQLAELFSIPSWDAILELNQDNLTFSDDENNEAYYQAERDLYLKWHTGVVNVAEHVLDKHCLELQTDSTDDAPDEYRVNTSSDWKQSLGKILDTINGVGIFYHGDLYEFLEVNNFPDPETAVQKSFGWVKHYPAVYGDSVKSRFHQAFRN